MENLYHYRRKGSFRGMQGDILATQYDALSLFISTSMSPSAPDEAAGQMGESGPLVYNPIVA